MKKIFITIFSLLFYASIALADAVDDRLPPETPDQLKASTRQMIQAGLKDDVAIKMTRSMLENEFTIDNALKAHQIIMKAHNKGLPLEPLENKAFEGMTKHVKAHRIVRAMQTVLSRHAFAYERAAVLSKQKEQLSRLGNALAAGLAAGLNNQDAAQICSTVQNRAQNMSSIEHNSLAFETLKTARDMARLSVASKAVADVLIQALQKGYSAKEMKTMRAAFMSHSRTTSPQNLAKSYSKAFQQGKSTHGLERPAGHGHSGGSGGSGGPGGSGGSGGAGGSGGGSGGSGGTGGSGGSGGGSGGPSGAGGGGDSGGSGGTGGGSGGSGGGSGGPGGSGGSGGAGGGSGGSGGNR